MFASSAGSATANQVQGNLIGTDLSGTQPLGNIVGVYINGAAGNQVGGTSSGAGNVISGNSSVGVEIYGGGSISNRIEGNIIGLAADGRGAFRGNNGLFVQSVGVYIQAASDNLIGGAGVGSGNVISGNESAGVFIVSSGGRSQGNSVQGNFIGLGENVRLGPWKRRLWRRARQLTEQLDRTQGIGANQFGRNGIADIRRYSGPQTGSVAGVAASLGDGLAAAHPKGPALHVRHKLVVSRAERLRKPGGAR